MNKIGTLTFECNICGTLCHQPVAALNREVPSCLHCGSTVRMRGMIHALSLAMFGRSITLPKFPTKKEIVGKGTSDWDGYAIPLSQKLGYTNTYYHKAPFLDISSITDADVASVDFLLSTDVFEHVAPPVSRAFENAQKMLKPDGVFVFSVPYTLESTTVEHFPELHDFKIENRTGGRVLINTTKDGRIQEFSSLVFHGGEGETIEMRVFSEKDLLRDLKDAGFGDVQIMSAPYFDFGIWWPHPCSLPIIARKSPVDIRIANWGPNMTRTNNSVNLQPGGGSGIWIKLQAHAPARTLELHVGDRPAVDVTVSGDLITGIIPEVILGAVGSYPIVIRDPLFTKDIPVGVFSVYD